MPRYVRKELTVEALQFSDVPSMIAFLGNPDTKHDPLTPQRVRFWPGQGHNAVDIDFGSYMVKAPDGSFFAEAADIFEYEHLRQVEPTEEEEADAKAAAIASRNELDDEDLVDDRA